MVTKAVRTEYLIHYSSKELSGGHVVCNWYVRFHPKFHKCIIKLLRVSQSKTCHKQKDLFRLQSGIYLPLHELQGCYSKPAKVCKAVSLPNSQLRCALVCVDNVWNMNREEEKKEKIKITEFCCPPHPPALK